MRLWFNSTKVRFKILWVLGDIQLRFKKWTNQFVREIEL